MLPTAKAEGAQPRRGGWLCLPNRQAGYSRQKRKAHRLKSVLPTAYE